MRAAISDVIAIHRVAIQGPTKEVQTDLLLDPGAAFTTISTAVLESAGYAPWEFKNVVSIVTANGVLRVLVVRVKAISIQELVVEDFDVCALTVPNMSHLKGLLGLNYLRHFRTVIDYRAGYLEIS